MRVELVQDLGFDQGLEWLIVILSFLPFHKKMHHFCVVLFDDSHLQDPFWLVSVQHMPVDLSLFVGTHTGRDDVELLESSIVLLVELARLYELLDEWLEMRYVFLILPCASLDVPVLPLDEVVLPAVLLLHIEDPLDFVELFVGYGGFFVYHRQCCFEQML